MQSVFALLVATLLLSSPLHAREVAGVSLPDSVQLGATALGLHGAGVRKKAFISVYVAGLYTEGKNLDAATAISAKTPKRMALHMLRDVGADKIRNAWREGFEANVPAAERAPIADAVDRFVGAFPDMKKGDTVWIDNVPGVGVRLTINNAPKATYPGDAFSAAVFKLWLGERPAQERLKKDLLGG